MVFFLNSNFHHDIQTTVHAARNIIESVIKNQNPYQYKINISIKQTA
jgi:hypothetical protein